MKRLLFALMMAALGLFAMTTAAFALSLSVTPWTYSHGANSGEGVFGNPPVTSKCTAAGLTLIKSGATSDDSSAGATIGGVSGITLSELGLDVLACSHFSGGARPPSRPSPQPHNPPLRRSVGAPRTRQPRR